MEYKDEDNEDKKYKKSYGRKEFKKDVAEAVKPELEKLKKKKKNICSQIFWQGYVRRLGRWSTAQAFERKKEGATNKSWIS